MAKSNDVNWSKFFQELDKIVNLDGLSANEKREKVENMAREWGSTSSLSEFISWFGGEYTE